MLIPAASVDDLADAIEDCLGKSSEELQALADNGYQRVIARHSIDAQAARLAALFRNPPATP